VRRIKRRPASHSRQKPVTASDRFVSDGGGMRRASVRRDQGDQPGRAQEGGRVQEHYGLDPAGRHGDAAERRPDQPGEIVVERVEGVRRDEVLLADEAREQGALGRLDDLLERGVDEGDGVRDPDPVGGFDREQRQQDDRLGEVGKDERPLPVPAVDQHSGERAPEDSRQQRRDEDPARA